jgi:hypothetical protein
MIGVKRRWNNALDGNGNSLYAELVMIEARGEKKRVALTVDLVDTLSRGIYTTLV